MNIHTQKAKTTYTSQVTKKRRVNFKNFDDYLNSFDRFKHENTAVSDLDKIAYGL